MIFQVLFNGLVTGAIISLPALAITLLFGMVAYDSPMPTGSPLFEFIVTFLIGSLSFTALALALTVAIPNAEAAPPIVNAAILPLLFLSGIFIPLDDEAPKWITTIADIFPVKHFADAMRAGFLGNLVGPKGQVFPFDWMDVAIVAGWGILGLVLAARFFSWEPRR